MLEGIFGNKTAERVLLHLYHFGEIHASGIAQDDEAAVLGFEWNWGPRSFGDYPDYEFLIGGYEKVRGKQRDACVARVVGVGGRIGGRDNPFAVCRLKQLQTKGLPG